jgi:hypothetical protein
MPIFEIVSSFEKHRKPLYQFGHTVQALDNQFVLLLEFAKHAEKYFSKVVWFNLIYNQKHIYILKYSQLFNITLIKVRWKLLRIWTFGIVFCFSLKVTTSQLVFINIPMKKKLTKQN